jgi:hypothetical protein
MDKAQLFKLGMIHTFSFLTGDANAGACIADVFDSAHDTILFMKLFIASLGMDLKDRRLQSVKDCLDMLGYKKDFLGSVQATMAANSGEMSRNAVDKQVNDLMQEIIQATGSSASQSIKDKLSSIMFGSATQRAGRTQMNTLIDGLFKLYSQDDKITEDQKHERAMGLLQNVGNVAIETTPKRSKFLSEMKRLATSATYRADQPQPALRSTGTSINAAAEQQLTFESLAKTVTDRARGGPGRGGPAPGRGGPAPGRGPGRGLTQRGFPGGTRKRKRRRYTSKKNVM